MIEKHQAPMDRICGYKKLFFYFVFSNCIFFFWFSHLILQVLTIKHGTNQFRDLKNICTRSKTQIDTCNSIYNNTIHHKLTYEKLRRELEKLRIHYINKPDFSNSIK